MRKAALAISILVIVAAVGSMLLRTRQRQSKINLTPYEALGAVLAEETGKLLDNQGQIVIVTFDPAQGRMLDAEAELAGLRKALKKQGSMSVVAVEPIRVQLHEVEGQDDPEADQIIAILEKHAGVGAVISLVGAPTFSDRQLRELPEQKPKLIVVGGPVATLKTLMQKGLVHVAVVPHLSASSAGNRSSHARELVDQFWLVVTPATAASLPD